MNKFKLAVVTLAVLIGWMVYRSPHATFATDGIDPDWDAAVAQSQAAHRPTVVLFTANWCPACRSLHQTVLSRSDVEAELRDNYTFYTVDLTKPSPQVQQHAQQCGVKYIPLLIRFDTNGKETARTNYLSPSQLIQWLKSGE